jgi:hypothetical protein
LLLLALISACGPQATKNTAAITPHPSPSPPGGKETATPASAPAPQGFNCKLPVVTDPSGGGWLTFPAGTYQADPKANVNLPTPSYFPLSRSYDKAFERWLPVPRDWISPDGKHYAYPELPAPDYHGGPTPPGGVHVVDIASGTDHFFNPGTPPQDSFWWVLDYETEGVYIAVQGNGPAPPTGLWQLDPPTGAVRKISDTLQSQYISGGGAWSTADALTGHGPGPGSRLLRTDLKTGAMESWYKRNDIEFTVAGADGQGHPILEVSKYQTKQLLLITGPGSATILLPAPGSAVPTLTNIVHPVADSHGIWLGDTAGTISLYTPETGIKQMAQVSTTNVAPAGGCH